MRTTRRGLFEIVGAIWLGKYVPAPPMLDWKTLESAPVLVTNLDAAMYLCSIHGIYELGKDSPRRLGVVTGIE